MSNSDNEKIIKSVRGGGSKNLALSFGESEIRMAVEWWMPAFGVWIPCVLGVIGLTGNIVNICVFCRLGLSKDSANITLMALAVADLGVMTFFLLDVVFFAYRIYDVDFTLAAAYNLERLSLSIGDSARQITTQVTCLLTSLLALQRCISVSMPFAVSRLFSPRRTVLSVLLIFILVCILSSPIYLSVLFKVDSGNIILLPTFIPSNLLIACYVFNKLVIRPLSIIVVIVCYCVIAVKVRASQVELQSNRHSQSHSRISYREKKMIKMVTVISVIFVVCYIPDTVIYCIITLYHTLSDRNISYRQLIMCDLARTLLEGINSSSNSIVLYAMSTNYRKALRTACGFKEAL